MANCKSPKTRISRTILFSNPRSKCNTVRVKGVRVSYRPDPGMIGRMSASMSCFSAEG